MDGEGKKRCIAIVLAAGRGTRMGTKVQKQYLELAGKPVLYYAMKVLEESGIIDDVILVAGPEQQEYIRSQIVEAYHFTKVRAITQGGAQRYDSVWSGLREAKSLWSQEELQNSYVFIHDGARPFIDEDMLGRLYENVTRCRACVAGVPSKDTVKLADEDGYARQTPDRRAVWLVQTPQVFEAPLIIEAYTKMLKNDCREITDDAMAVEQYMNLPVKMVEGSYRNIKITTPEDMKTAGAFVEENRENKK